MANEKDNKDKKNEKMPTQQIAELETKIAELKAQKKELSERYSFKAMYNAVKGKDTDFTVLKTTDKPDAEKIKLGIVYLKKVIADFE